MVKYRITPIYNIKGSYQSNYMEGDIPTTATNINMLRKRLIDKYYGKAAFVHVYYDNRKTLGILWFMDGIMWKTIDYIPNYGQIHTYYAVKKDGSLGRILKKK